MKVGEKTRDLGEALRDVADEQRLAYNWACIAEKRHQRPLVTGGLVLAVAAVMVAVSGIVGVVIWSRPDATPAALKPVLLELTEWTPVISVPSDASKEKKVPLSDGSLLTLAPGATLEVKESSAKKFETVLIKGWVRFNVVPGQGRTWVVDAGLGRFVVLGTQFTVSRTPREVKISVHRGTVALFRTPSGGEIARISAGESRRLLAPDRAVTLASALDESDEDTSTDENPSQKDEPKRRVKSRTRSAGRRSARPESPMTDLAGLGSSDPVNVLLRAADDARKRKSPQEAAMLLVRILREFPDDPARGVVALTLGRIRLDALHQPRAAAAAFKIAIKSKGIPTPLKEQAYARCVEAFHLAGENASARSMRDLYERRFPSGVWLPWVERWSGIE
jgi:hypothetical protein